LYIGLFCFALYLWTICPTVYVGDSGELTAAAYTLGIPHNSGYPLYALLGKVFCLIPIGNIGFRMNLMSAVFIAFSIGILHDMVLRITESRVASLAASLFLSFTPLFWQQSVSAEVYSLHIFFVAVLVRLSWWWDQERSSRKLMLLAFVSGLSFGNHMQTVMLAPALLFLVLFDERRSFFRPGRLLLLILLFSFALTIYLYLPIRTEAGAAITWGDPNTLDRFLAHVTGRVHRSVYVLNKGLWEYLERAAQGSSAILVQFGFLLLFALRGWLRGLDAKWRVYCVLVILSDFFYTIFLNTISLEITAFGHVTMFLLTLLCGLGIADILNLIKGSCRIGAWVKEAAGSAFALVPIFPLVFNFGLCNQNQNYTAYEHAANILRTPPDGSVLLVDGDNNVFPVIYARMCERLGDHVRLLDRYNLVFRWPSRRADEIGENSLKDVVDTVLGERPERPFYLCAFDPNFLPLPGNYRLVPHGVLTKVSDKESVFHAEELRRLWEGYSTLSFFESMERDYMNRQVCAYFHYNRSRFLFQIGDPAKGLDAARSASVVGYNDGSIHSDLGLLLTRHGLFREALRELHLALLYAENVSIVHNSLGYHYEASGDYEKAAASLRKAVELEPFNSVYLNNLGWILLKRGRTEEAVSVLKKSLAIDKEQPRIRSLVEEHADDFKRRGNPG